MDWYVDTVELRVDYPPPPVVSITVTDGTVAYGTLATSATGDTTDPDQMQTVNNNGTVAVDLTIKSSNATGGTQWSLGASAGADIFTHKASLDDGSSWPVAMTVADTYVALSSGLAASDTETFDLQIGIPASITDGIQKSITVTVLATAA